MEECCWPKCGRPRTPDLPLCTAHITVVRKYNPGPRPVGKVAAEPKPQKPPVVYYLQMGDIIKIGFTTNLATRVRTYPPHAEVLAIEPGGREVEVERHQQFKAHLTAGNEWFRMGDDLMAHVAAMRTEHGSPASADMPRRRRHHPVDIRVLP